MAEESAFYLRMEEAIAKGEIESVRVKDIKDFLKRKGLSEESFRHLRLKRDLFEFAEQVAREDESGGDSPRKTSLRSGAIRKDPLPAPDPDSPRAWSTPPAGRKMAKHGHEEDCDCNLSQKKETRPVRLPTPPPLVFP